MLSKMFYYLIIFIVYYFQYARWAGNDKRRNQNYAAFIRQHVALSGLNSDPFNKSLEAFAKVHRYFGDLLPADKLECLQSISIDGSAALNCHTRYFTSHRNCLGRPVKQPFGLGVDPNGDLERIKGDTYIHMEDNVVQYMEEKKGDEGSWYAVLKRYL